MTRFEAIIDRVLGHEGGYVDDVNDPGGETQWGISKRQYPGLDIKALTREDAKAIYYRDYWLRARCDDYDEAIAYQLMDAAANHGVETAIRFLQRALGVADDGWVGPITLDALRTESVTDTIYRFNAERLLFYTKLNTWQYFGRGWARRIAGNLAYASQDS